MFYLISGGSGSGKSEFAETTIEHLQNKDKKAPLLYIATMLAFDSEAEEKIRRHRLMRKHRGFETKECYFGLKDLRIPENSMVLLDCMSNLVANEMFQKDGAKEASVEEILLGIYRIKQQSSHLVVVTNDISFDGGEYEETTQKYIENLGMINKKMAESADMVIEVVCGIPIYHKKSDTKEEWGLC